MSSALRAVWETLVGLVVEDSQLALGIVAALIVVWLAAQANVDVSGWLLLVLLLALLVVNLLLTARHAKRRIS